MFLNQLYCISDAQNVLEFFQIEKKFKIKENIYLFI